jgi:GTP-binding protein
VFQYKRIFGPVVPEKQGKFIDTPLIFWLMPQKQGEVREKRLIMEINSAYFFRSAQHYSQLPPADKPEFAFVGRSNVGKSSLINKLVNQKGLAKTSSTPGKTQLINHFVINKTWYLVDLPGFGYARVSKKTRAQFQGMIQDYVSKRSNLVTVFVLVDSRHEPQKIDLEFMEYLGISEVPFAIVFTKTDKLGKATLQTNIELYQNALLEKWEELPPCFVTSADTGVGCPELRAYIGENLALIGHAIGQKD